MAKVRDYPENRKSRRGYKGRHQDGEITRNWGGARDNRPVHVSIRNGQHSHALMHGRLDGRTSLGKQYKAALAALKDHLGVEVSYPQSTLADQAARLSLLANMAWAEIMRADGLVQDGTVNPSVDVFLKTSRHQREVLGLLGIQRRAKDISLQDVLEGRVEHGQA